MNRSADLWQHFRLDRRLREHRIFFRPMPTGLSFMSEYLQANVAGHPSFSAVALNNQTRERLASLGIDKMYKIQAKTLPLSLAGKDVAGSAGPGSGKTLSFVLPVIEKLKQLDLSPQPRAVLVFSTVESCIGARACFESLAPNLRLGMACRGASAVEQLQFISSGCDVVLGTPGRLVPFFHKGVLRLNRIQFVILDEAGDLLTGKDAVRVLELIRSCPSDRQTLLFSASLSQEARATALKIMRNPEFVEVEASYSAETCAPSVASRVTMEMTEGREVGVIMHLLEKHKPKSALILVPTKRVPPLLSKYLERIGVSCKHYSGHLSLSDREKTLGAFRARHFAVLVATDAAVHGVDMDLLDLIIQCEPRTSRANSFVGCRVPVSVLLYYPRQKTIVDEIHKSQPLLVHERAPQPKITPGKPWEGVLHEYVGLTENEKIGHGERSYNLYRYLNDVQPEPNWKGRFRVTDV